MTIRSVIGDEIKNDFQPPLMRCGYQVVKFVQRSEQSIDVAIIADIIAAVGHGRGIDRGNPERINAEPFKIAKTLLYSSEVTDSIAICILEGPWIDLIDDAVLPPSHP